VVCLVRSVSIKYIFLFFIIVLGSGHVYAQKITISGTVFSSTGELLENANILAFAVKKNATTVFSISRQRGKYQLKMEKGVTYTITVSYLGYDELVFEYTALKDDIRNLVLIPKPKVLDEVVLEYKIPIEFKEDTIIYQIDAFANGKERKLREVLKKLPGIEVDREGNVTAQGKVVTKVLVEDKTFFTGNSKLAVNNIPADAVDQVQVLENYNEIGFLKGLQNSDELVLNIKLKEDKKKFAFGDVEVAGGPDKRYSLHPNLFYYSPNTTLNFIGDFNNVGAKLFELGDYIEFNGGFGKLLGDVRGYISLANDDFSQFLSNTNFRANTKRFGALNVRQSVSKNIDINSYLIANSSDTETQVNTLNTFNSNNIFFTENRTNTKVLDNFFLLGKLTLDYEPNSKEDFAANTFVKLTNNDASGTLLTQSFEMDNNFTTNSSLKTIDIRQNLEYSKRFSKKQTLSIESTVNLVKSTPINNWVTDQFFLEDLIPLQDDNLFDILQELDRQTTTIDLIVKDYWVLNNFNHLYTTIGTNLLFDSRSTQEIQRLSDGSINSFTDNGFGNEIDYRFTDTFLGLEYKFLSGIFSIKSGLFYHNYLWDNSQLGNSINNTTIALLPEFYAEAEFNNSEKLQFRYLKRLRFPQSNRLFGNFLLNSFNSVFLGNPNLQNERFHSVSLNYYKFSFFRGLNLNAVISYNRKTQSIKNSTRLDSIEQFVTYTIFNQPENSLTANFRFSKRAGKVKLSVDASGNYNEFFQLVNDNVSKNFSKSLSITGKIETFFEKLPNLEIGYSLEPSNFETSAVINEFINKEFFGALSYEFLKSFKLNADFKQVNYENRTQHLTNIFSLANTSLFYQKEDSPWGFEISTTNLFNTQIRRQNSFSDFLISDETTFIIPRVVLLKVVYKL